MSYLQNVVDLLRRRAYFSSRLNWDEWTERARSVAATTPSPRDCYPLIQEMVAALGDNHSFFIGAEQRGQEGPGGAPLGFGAFVLSPEFVVIELFPGSPADRAGVRRGDYIEWVNGTPPQPSGSRRLVFDPQQPVQLRLRRGGQTLDVTMQAAPIEHAPLPHGRDLGDGIAYLELFVQGNPAEAQRYIDASQQVLHDHATARAWIVDLRCDRGGNMWPMLAGAGPLMGEGLLGMFVDADGSQTRWFYQAGAAAYQRAGMDAPQEHMRASLPAAPRDPQTTPVAVLTSEFTGSSGEMTLIAFRGRPNTRTFGATTSGEITGVAMHELDDGALLGIAESVAADRTGHIYYEAIAPDEPVAVDWLRYAGNDDPVIAAARRWLNERGG
ncbi:MAG: hypothetical protein JNJ61_24515 [Anaerolineae bacterium]|nr:hypothetical protein [Anaerolineae bacterium]